MSIDSSEKTTQDLATTDLPKGFEFGAVACGVKESGSLDLTIISTDEPAVAAGVYTQNVVRASSIDWNRSVTPTDQFRGLVINSGNANACTGGQGEKDNAAMAQQLADHLGGKQEQVAVLSTGVIGHLLPMDKIESGIKAAYEKKSQTIESFDLASQGILTTDKSSKTVVSSCELNSGTIRLAGMAKGAGMIGPNMATMLGAFCTDAKISKEHAQAILSRAADLSFNRISVEGHTSTNDALMLICSGASGVELTSNEDLEKFEAFVTEACIQLATQIPSDGEGASHLVSIEVTGATSDEEAERVARTIAASALVKTAVTGADPNWGRIVSAAGYSGATMVIDETDLSLNGHCVFKSGQPVEFDEAKVSQSMASNFETRILLKVGAGDGSARHWTSDLTVDYVRFNSEYTT